MTLHETGLLRPPAISGPGVLKTYRPDQNPNGYGTPVRETQTPEPLEAKDLVFQGRYPSLQELLPEGGYPGTSYILVPLDEIQKWRGEKVAFDDEYAWEPLSDFPVHLVLTIEGDKGSCQVVLLGGGKPVRCGGAAGNRNWLVADSVVQATGVWPDPAAHLENAPKVTEEETERAAQQKGKHENPRKSNSQG